MRGEKEKCQKGKKKVITARCIVVSAYIYRSLQKTMFTNAAGTYAAATHGASVVQVGSVAVAFPANTFAATESEVKMGGRAWYSMIKEFGVSPIVRNKRQAHIRTSFAMRHRLGDASESHLAVQSLLSVALPLRRGKIHGAVYDT